MKANKIGLFILVLFIIGSIDSLRNMPAAALFGPSLIFFFIASAITFLLPIALISAELSSYRSEKNGIYQWVKEAFGNKAALIAIWLQWINTAIWFPTILSFIAGGLAYLFDPGLVHNKLYVVSVILTAFWSMTLLSLKDLALSAKFAAFCAIFGFVLPFLVIVALFSIWVINGNPVQIHIDWQNIFPEFTKLDNWVSLTAVITAFLGMELAAVNVQDIKNPQRTYPIGVLIAATIILCTMILGSLAIAFVIPATKISLIAGIFEMLKYYLAHFHLMWLVFILSVLIVFSSLGEMINWIISPARGLQQAAMSGDLPKLFTRINSHGMPAPVLIAQAIIVTLVCLAFTLFKTVNDIYWLLTDLSTELYVFMYLMMFVAAIKLHYKDKHIKKPFCIPGGQLGKWLLCTFGIISCIITLSVGFIPPKTLNLSSGISYSWVFVLGLMILILPGLLLTLKSNKK